MAEPDLWWDDPLSIAIPLLALVPFVIACLAYRRTPTSRVLMFTIAFGLFFLKGIVIAAEVVWFQGSAALDALEIMADALILIFFFVGMVKG